MSIAKTVKQYLDNKHVIYDVLDVPRYESPYQAAQQAKIPPRSLYYPVILRDPYGLIMAVLPASHRPDSQRLAAMLHRNIEPAFETQLSSVFSDCQPGNIPPLGEAYGIRTIIDANLTTPEEVYVVAGDHSRIIKLSRKDFMLMQANAWLANDFALPLDDEKVPVLNEVVEHEAFRPRVKHAPDKARLVRERIEQITEIPAMPNIAKRLFELQADPDASALDLVKVIEQDPSLAAQVMRYANSPFFGYRGKIDNLHVAIARVLGFDMVMNLAVGLSLVQPFKIPKHGPLGLDACWRHAVYSAGLMQLLSKSIPQAKRLRPATCYLIGLLHDFGYFVLGHYFQEEFYGLTQRVALRSRNVKRDDVEQGYLGLTHGTLGYWLLKAWHLPDEVVVAVREHHSEAYDGPFSSYVHLARLADHLLNLYETRQTIVGNVPNDMLAPLGLDETQVINVIDQLSFHDKSLQEMSRFLAAA